MKKSMLAIIVGMLTLASLPRFAPVEILAVPTPNQNGYPSASKTGIAAVRRAAKKRRRAK